MTSEKNVSIMIYTRLRLSSPAGGFPDAGGNSLRGVVGDHIQLQLMHKIYGSRGFSDRVCILLSVPVGVDC